LSGKSAALTMCQSTSMRNPSTPRSPESHHVVHRRLHGRITPVEIRPLLQEGMVVILAKRDWYIWRDAAPDGPGLDRRRRGAADHRDAASFAIFARIHAAGNTC
jgi:hypothetical protein